MTEVEKKTGWGNHLCNTLSSILNIMPTWAVFEITVGKKLSEKSACSTTCIAFYYNIYIYIKNENGTILTRYNGQKDILVYQNWIFKT